MRADLLARPASVRKILVHQQHAAGRRPEQAVHVLDHRRLAGSGMSDQSDKFSLFHGERHMVERFYRQFAVAPRVFETDIFKS